MARNKNVWTKEALEEAVKNNETISGVLRDLGISVLAGNFTTFRKKVAVFGLDISHFADRKAGRHPSRLRFSLDEILVVNSTYRSRSSLTRRLLKSKLLVYSCASCGVKDWCNRPLVLHLDHINGINNDNRIENLRLLCPNCHSQTDTYAGRNRDKCLVECLACSSPTNRTSDNCQVCQAPHGHPISLLSRMKRNCVDCGISLSVPNLRCLDCRGKLVHKRPSKIVWPDPVSLQSRAAASSCSQVAKELGVSDQSVRKFLKKNGLDVPRAQTPRGRKKK